MHTHRKRGFRSHFKPPRHEQGFEWFKHTDRKLSQYRSMDEWDIRKSNTSRKVMMNFHNGSRIASSLGNAFQNTGSINSQMKILCGVFLSNFVLSAPFPTRGLSFKYKLYARHIKDSFNGYLIVHKHPTELVIRLSEAFISRVKK